jgi:cytochrome c biogenesis protein CcmG/thiol:disulfide interchange protein DsbE
MRPLRFLVPLGVFALLAVLMWRGLSLDPREVPSPLIGRPAPAFALPRLDDAARVMQRDDLRGRPWVLNVWASWCTACLQEHALLVEFARAGHVPLIGLNYKDRRPDAMQWLQRHGNPYDASLFDEHGRVGIDFGVYGVPETFVIDRDGIVRLKHVGPLTRDVLRQRVEPLLEQLGG